MSNARTVPITNDAIESAPSGGAARPRVALLCDLVEENWPSMELVSDMLFRQLRRNGSVELDAEQLRPHMRRRFERLPIIGKAPAFHNADRLLGRFVDYPRWLRRRAADFDLFHIVDHSYSQLVHCLPAARTVVTCHDLDTFRCLLDPAREPRPGWFCAMSRRILRGLQKAAHVITVSSATRDEILRWGLLPAERITMIHNGVHPACTPAGDAAADTEACRILPENGGRALWLLNVGSVIPRKRMDVLLRVFAAVRQELPGTRLLRVGGGFTAAQQKLAWELGIEDNIHVLPNVSPDVLAAVYRRADLLLQTAESEGFGLPVVEAQACGCAVVASDIPVLREVGGAPATYCPVGDIARWKDAILRLAVERTADPHAWQHRSQQGIAHAAGFSWGEAARKVVRVYETVLQQNRPN